jgi:hypothetical protein
MELDGNVSASSAYDWLRRPKCDYDTLNGVNRNRDLFYCDRQCRWHLDPANEGSIPGAFLNRCITGKPSGSSCTCENEKTGQTLPDVPYHTPYDFVGPSDTYENAKKFNADYWADKYSTSYICVLPKDGAKPETRTMDSLWQNVCAIDDNLQADEYCQNEKDKLEVKDKDGKKDTILHCGKCSACSALRDIEVLYKTKDYITTEMTDCSSDWVANQKGLRKSFYAAPLGDLKKCLVEKGIDFSDDGSAWEDPTDKPSCMDVWTDNILNDASLCVSNCLSKFNPWDTNKGNFAKDKCLQCDEYKSGPAFIWGAGANRRSSGIVSDIDRGQLEGKVWEQKICKIGFYSPRIGHGTPP